MPLQALERAVLVGVRHPKQTALDARESLEELARLAQTAGASVAEAFCQEVKQIEAATYIGKGKLEEIRLAVERHRASLVLFDEDLSPAQARNVANILSCKVVDRTGLILDIFARHARSREGKLQVELAQCMYLMPRLVGQWEHLGRLGGGIGTRGPGETQLEVDRRRLRERAARLRVQLAKVERSRHLHRHKRAGVPIPTVAMVGYTNAGKSTLMNRLTEAGVLVEDKLFATLDPTVRRLRLPSGREVLLSDTVGFIRKLPHQLVEAFKATFEEVRAADLLLHVIDVSHPTWSQQKAVVEKVLQELKLEDKPRLEVFNKIDLLGAASLSLQGLCVSAREGRGMPELLREIERKLYQEHRPLSLHVPYRCLDELNWLYQVGQVQTREDTPDGITLEVVLSETDAERAKKKGWLKGSRKKSRARPSDHFQQ